MGSVSDRIPREDETRAPFGLLRGFWVGWIAVGRRGAVSDEAAHPECWVEAPFPLRQGRFTIQDTRTDRPYDFVPVQTLAAGQVSN